jgi:hypothetical protein
LGVGREANNLTPLKLSCSETRQSASDGWIEQKSTSVTEQVKGWGGKMKNREKWRLTVQEAKAHPEL